MGVGPGAGPADAEEDAVDDALAVDGVRKRLPDLHLGEQGIVEVIAQVGEGVGRIPELAIVVLDAAGLALAQVLERVQPHHVDAAGKQLLEHGGTVGDDAVDELIDPALFRSKSDGP